MYQLHVLETDKMSCILKPRSQIVGLQTIPMKKEDYLSKYGLIQILIY